MTLKLFLFHFNLEPLFKPNQCKMVNISHLNESTIQAVEGFRPNWSNVRLQLPDDDMLDLRWIDVFVRFSKIHKLVLLTSPVHIFFNFDTIFTKFEIDQVQYLYSSI